MTGPSIQAVGLAWQTLHAFTSHLDNSFDARHLIFEPAVLVVVVGFLVSLVCIPAAIEVARAAPEELRLPFLGAGEEEETGRRARRMAAR